MGLKTFTRIALLSITLISAGLGPYAPRVFAQGCVPPTIVVSSTAVSCPGAANGTITVSAVSNNNPSTILEFALQQNGQTVAPFQRNSVFAGLAAGSYTAVVREVGTTCAASANTTIIGLNAAAITSITNITTTGATVNWSSAQITTSYNIRYRVLGSSMWITVSNITGNTRSIIGLQHNTTYEVQLASNCNGTVGGYSSSSTFTTLTANSNNNCNVPSGVYTTFEAYSSAGITWTPLPNARCYYVSYGLAGSSTSTWAEIQVTAPTNSLTITGLTPNTQYRYRVRANCTTCSPTFGALSAYSPLQPITTLPCATSIVVNGGASSASGCNSVVLSAGQPVPSTTYQWFMGNTPIPNATTTTYTATMSGSYSIRVTPIGCSILNSAPITVTVTPGPTLTRAVQNVSCSGQSNGSITVTATGGSSPYIYNWSTGATTSTLSFASPGTYTVTVTDASGCAVTTSATIAQPANLAVNIIPTNVSCYGGANGAAEAIVQGGTAPFTYRWNTNATSRIITGLIPGDYTVTVTDAAGCTQVAYSPPLTEPAELFVDYNATNNVTCNGLADGSLDITPGGGVPPYRFNWSNGQTTEDLQNLPAALYTLTLTDANNCTFQALVLITEPSALLVSALATDVTCATGDNGSIDATVSGGMPPYNFLWSSGQTTEDLTGVGRNTYVVVVTDNRGCTTSTTVTVDEPLAIDAQIISINNVSCFNGNDGAIDINVIGGVGSYTFNWSNGQTTEDLTGLSAGIYTVTLRDANNCTVLLAGEVTQPSTFAVQAISTGSITCFGGTTGAAQANILTGGEAPFTFAWSDGVTATQSISNLTAGTYTVTVTDNLLCTATASVVITAPEQIAANFTVTQIACNGLNNGAIAANPINGTAPYSYVWNTGHTTATRTNLTAGDYTVTISDAVGCTVVASVTLNQPALLDAQVTAIQITCFGAGDGVADLTVVGGVEPYSYQWSDVNNTTTQDLTNLQPGNYTVTVTDANGCTAEAVAIITEPGILSPVVSGLSISCFGLNDGSATTSVLGGTAPFTFAWSNGSSFQDLFNLTANTYTVTVTDAAGCTASVEVTIAEPDPITLTFSTTNVRCKGAADGTALVIPAGGTPDFSYAWSGLGATTASVANLAPATYTATVTDSRGCTTQASFIITEPATLLTITTGNRTDVRCPGFNTGGLRMNVAGGVTPYAYAWSNGVTTGDTISNLIAGDYTLTVTDDNNCVVTHSATITQPPAITATFTTTNASCFKALNAAIDAFPTGGTGPTYTFAWSNGAFTQNLSGLRAGTYTATITDAIGCTGVASATVTEPPSLPMQITHTTDTIFCRGGTVVLSAATGAYTYQWRFNNNTIAGAIARTYPAKDSGYYQVAITDIGSGCTQVSDSFFVKVLPLPDTTLTPNVASAAFCSSAGLLRIEVPFQPHKTYLWMRDGVDLLGNTDNFLDVGMSGNYRVLITDTITGCRALARVLPVTVTATPTVGITPAGPLSFCSSDSVLLNSNAVGADMYQWFINGVTIPGAIHPTHYARTGGQYTVVVSVSGTCPVTSNTVVLTTQPSPDAIISPNSPQRICEDGTVVFTAGVGVSYQWFYNGSEITSGGTGAIYNARLDGFYKARVTGANGCSRFTDSVRVIVLPKPKVTLDTTAGTPIFCAAGSVTIGIKAPYEGDKIYRWTRDGIDYNDSNGGPARPHGAPSWILTQSGNYRINVLDTITGCERTTIAFTVLAVNVQATFTNVNPSCNGGNTGAIFTTPFGGQAPYSFVWNRGDITQNLTNALAGTYTVTITDHTGCSASFVNNLVNPTGTAITATVISTTQATCASSEDGAADLSVTGGVGPYSFLWSNGATTEDLTNMRPGTYTVSVTDPAGCYATAQAIITSMTGTAALTTPTNITETSADINWTATTANGYDIAIRRTGATNWFIKRQPNGAATSINIDQLAAGTQYQVRIRTICAGSAPSPWSAISTFATASPATSCQNAWLSAVTNITTTSAQINWIAPAFTVPAVQCYVVEYRPSGGTAFFAAPSVPAASTSTTITGLNEGTQYDIRLRTRCGACNNVSEAFVLRPQHFTTILSRDNKPVAAPQDLFRVYPNPSNGIFTVQYNSDAPKTLHISLVDLTGREVFARSYDVLTGTTPITVEATTIPVGVYTLRVATDESPATHTRIVIR